MNHTVTFRIRSRDLAVFCVKYRVKAHLDGFVVSSAHTYGVSWTGSEPPPMLEGGNIACWFGQLLRWSDRGNLRAVRAAAGLKGVLDNSLEYCLIEYGIHKIDGFVYAFEQRDENSVCYGELSEREWRKTRPECAALQELLQKGNTEPIRSWLEENRRLCKSSVSTNVLKPLSFPFSDPSELAVLPKKVFCLTKEFSCGTKSYVKRCIQRNGGECSDYVTNKVNVLLVGEREETDPDWVQRWSDETPIERKRIETALVKLSAGQRILFVKERDFFRFVLKNGGVCL